MQNIDRHLEDFTHRFAKWAGSASGFVVALSSIFVWFIAGEYYRFSSKWEDSLVLYIGIVTFLMVFLIQRGQNKEISILHLKLNELIAATNQADNSVINADTLSEQEIHEVRDEHRKIGEEKV